MAFDYECPLDVLGRIYNPASPVAPCGFTSTGWETQDLADARGAQHVAEHETGEPMVEEIEFQYPDIVRDEDGQITNEEVLSGDHSS